MKQLRMDGFLLDSRTGDKFTVIVPSNSAWEKAQMDFSQAYNTIVDRQFPQYVSKWVQYCEIRYCLSNFIKCYSNFNLLYDIIFTLGREHHKKARPSGREINCL